MCQVGGATGQAVSGRPGPPAPCVVLGCPTDRAMPFPELTDRDRDILDLLAGLGNAAIGDDLHLSAKTVANTSRRSSTSSTS